MNQSPSNLNVPLAALNDIATLDVTSLAGVGVQVTGTWVGTVTFQCSIDGVNFQPMTMEPSNNTTITTTSSSNGIWIVNCAAYAIVRVKMTSFTSGIALVSILGCGGGAALH